MYQVLQPFDNFVIRSLTHDFLSSINICWAETPSAIDAHPLSGFYNHNIELESQYGIKTIAHMHSESLYHLFNNTVSLSIPGRFGSVGDDLDISKDKRGGGCRKVIPRILISQLCIPTPSQVCFVAYFLASWAIAAIILLLIFFDLDMLKMDTFDI